MAFLRVDEQQRIYGGSLVNLNEMINRFSHGRVKARLEAQAVALDSPDLIEKHIPYVFLTGRRDFQLTDAEITNLRAYLNRGGCLWGDSGVPGRRSAFDVAFRREMRRLIPDPDKSFEALPPSHPVYRESFFPLAGAPAGLNRSREPVEVIKIEGVEAVIYTSNGYGAMWQATLDDEMKRVDRAIMTQAERVAYAKRSILFRNWEEAALLDSYRLGVNMTTYLLTRFQRGLDGG
jgi:hypothetical protein